MNITVTFPVSPYNSRRYGKPWGAVITFDGAKPRYDFSAGSYLGDSGGGEIVIICRAGDIIARGQRDNRNPKYTENEWHVVSDDGSPQAVSQADAFRHWSGRQG